MQSHAHITARTHAECLQADVDDDKVLKSQQAAYNLINVTCMKQLGHSTTASEQHDQESKRTCNSLSSSF
jgi:hypothetical protein